MRMMMFVALAAALALGCGDGATSGSNGDDGDNGGNGSTNNGQTTSCAGCTLPESGECVNGDSPSACGLGGGPCRVCETGFCTESGTCVDAPSCGPDNCNGCCDASGECLGGTALDACGRGGLACENCSTGSTCDGGTCVPDCGPDTCAGCCSSGGVCAPGTDDGQCGTGGSDCSDCAAIGSVCLDAQCVAPECAETCSGCCNGDDCVVVATGVYCGADGSACVDCGSGRTCNDGSCVVDPDADWTLTITTGEVAATTVDGESWDGFNGLPDPRVDVEVGGRLGSTSGLVDVLTLTWNEEVITATAEEYFGGMTFYFIDEDVALDDTICEIAVPIDPNHPAFDGGVIDAECPDQPESFIRWRLAVRE